MSEFTTFLTWGDERGGFETDDVLAAVLPLMREVQALHEAANVAPLRGVGAIRVMDERVLSLGATPGIAATSNTQRLRELLAPPSKGLEIITESTRETDLDSFSQDITNLAVGSATAALTRPIYVPGYITWEHLIGHHDAL